MILILGLRDWNRDGRVQKRDMFFEKGWRVNKVQDIFNPIENEKLLSKIPNDEQYNLYFTVADCFEEQGRKLREQWAIPFDIDGLDLPEGKELEAADKAARAACIALGIRYEDTAIVFTGNGVQLFIFTQSPITEEDYFERTRLNYAVLCKRIQSTLDKQGIAGKVDASVWSKARLMRLPNTINRKPNKPERKSYIISTGGESVAYDVVSESGIAMVTKGEVMPDVVLKNYPKPDTKAICAGCKFLVNCKENPSKVDEPAWYAMVSVTSRLEDGDALTHEYSSGHPDYNPYETDNKIEQALASAGPRTCADISTRWDGCPTCEYWGKITSPIMIKGPDYISSADFGFRERKKVDNKIVAGKPMYSDLKKQFSVEHPYKVVKDNDQIILYNGKYWEFTTDREIKAWCMQRVKPEPSNNEMLEFVSSLKAHNVTSFKELQSTREGMINFSNSVLDVRTGKVYPHSADFGFFDVRPYGYDSTATSPLFDKFLMDVMGDDEERVLLLKEFAGYCISGDEYWLQSALILYGDGANGKSVFMELLGEVVGETAYSAVPMQDLTKDTLRFQLVNKLFNYSEETSVGAFSDSSLFKTLISGGLMTVKQLYAQPYMVPNRAKIIMSSNKLPAYTDDSYGFLRRLIIVRFSERFEPGDGKHDYDIKKKLMQELPGICNTILKAYHDAKERGHLSARGKITEEVKKYEAENNTVVMFLDGVLVKEEGRETKVLEVYQEYVQMCEMSGLKPVNNVHFGRQLSHLAGVKSHLVKRERSVYRAYIGVTLNKEY